MDAGALFSIALMAGGFTFSVWVLARCWTGRPPHWAIRVLSIPAVWIGAMAAVFALAIAMGWSGEDTVHRMTRGASAAVLLHIIYVFWGYRHMTRGEPAAQTTPEPPTTETEKPGAATRVIITLFCEETDLDATEARAQRIQKRVRSALPQLTVEVNVSANPMAAEPEYPQISTDATDHESHLLIAKQVEAILSATV